MSSGRGTQAMLAPHQNTSTEGCGGIIQPDGSTRSPVRAAQGQRPISALTQRLENEPRGCAVSRSEPRGAN